MVSPRSTDCSIEHDAPHRANGGDDSQRPYLTVDEFVDQSGFSRATVNRYLKAGKLPKFQPGGPRCRVLIPREALVQAGQATTVTQPCEATLEADRHIELESPNDKTPDRCGPKPQWLKRRQEKG